jgi:hypothetical protein
VESKVADDLFVAGDKFEEEVWPGFVAEILAGDGDEPFEVELVGADEHVRHLLLFVRFVAHVG